MGRQFRSPDEEAAVNDDGARARTDDDGGGAAAALNYVDEQGNELSWEARGNLIGAPPVQDRGETPGSGRPPNRGIVENEAVFQQRRAAAEASLALQRARADEMLNAGYGKLDNRYWFSKVYSFVTENEIMEADRGTFFYPSYVMQSVRYFEKLYEDNLNAADAGRQAEEHWETAFRTTRDEDGFWGSITADPLEAVTGGLYRQVLSLVHSMQAHIRYDLPRAEAWVFQSYYAHMDDANINDFAEDFNAMMGVFERAGVAMNEEIDRHNLLPAASALPRAVQDMAMDWWFDADMATERADTWQRTQALVDQGLIGADPYRDSADGMSLEGDATLTDNTSNLERIQDPTLRPTMDSSAEMVDDDDARADINSMTDAQLAQLDLGTRVRMVRGMLDGLTWNADENAIIRLVRVSNDVVALMDGANAYDVLLNNFHGSQYNELRRLLRERYYPRMSFSVAVTYLRRCMDGVTFESEEDMVMDILEAHSERRRIVTRIGQLYEGGGFAEGLLYLEGQLDWSDETRLTNLFGSSGLSSGDSAIRDRVANAQEGQLENMEVEGLANMIRRLQRGWTGEADQDTVIELLEAARRGGKHIAVITQVGAWSLAQDLDGAQWRQVRGFFRSHYYPRVDRGVAFRLIVTCLNGYTSGWEQEMVADIVTLRSDGRDLITRIGQYYEEGGFTDGLNKLEWQLSGSDERRVTSQFGSSGRWW